MSLMPPPSAAGGRSDVFSASQYGGHAGGGVGGSPSTGDKQYRVNFFVVPIFVLELIGLACLWALFYYLRFTNVFPYHHRVFSCQDESLSKPNFTPDDFNVYVSEELLYCVSFIIPPFVILIGEIMFWLFSTKPRKTVLANCTECKVHLFTRRLFRFVSTFMFGALIVCIFIDSIKLMTGYQRPYFLTLCNVTHPAACNRLNHHSPSFSPELVCQTRLEHDLRYAWLSFPSLYAGLSSFAAIFTSCYIHYMISLRGAPLLRPFLVYGFLGLAMIASFSRIQGYKNHWIDVWVAWIIGGLSAIYLCHNVLCFQEFYRIIREEEILPQQRISPFFSWFRLPRVQAAKEPTYSVYAEDEGSPRPPVAGQGQGLGPNPNSMRRRNHRDNQRTYEVTTTTESFQRTIHPPPPNPDGSPLTGGPLDGYGGHGHRHGHLNVEQNGGMY